MEEVEKLMEEKGKIVALSKASIEQDEIVHALKKDLQLKQVRQKILYRRVVERAAQERGITVTPEEIQAEFDRIRYEKRLERATDTLEWLREQMIALDDLEAGIRDRLLEKKLAECLFSKDVEKFFAQNRLDFEQILLYQTIVLNEKIAQELFYQIEEQEISFYEAAHLYDLDEGRRRRCGYEGKLYRWKLKPDIASAVFGAPIGEVIGPLQTEQGYHLLKVEDFFQPS